MHYKLQQFSLKVFLNDFFGLDFKNKHELGSFGMIFKALRQRLYARLASKK